MPDEPLITSLPLIRRYSRHNEAEDDRFATFLKHHLPLSDRELDTLVRETADAVCEGIDCLSCGNCCHSPRIGIDSKDIARLAKRLTLTQKEFEHKYLVREGGEPWIAGGPCPFLGEGNVCQVYEDRPQACQDFPYIRSENFRSRTYTTLAYLDSCPIVFNTWQRLKTIVKPTPSRPRGKRRR
jgi:uncharacterized protein